MSDHSNDDQWKQVATALWFAIFLFVVVKMIGIVVGSQMP